MASSSHIKTRNGPYVMFTEQRSDTIEEYSANAPAMLPTFAAGNQTDRTHLPAEDQEFHFDADQAYLDSPASPPQQTQLQPAVPRPSLSYFLANFQQPTNGLVEVPFGRSSNISSSHLSRPQTSPQPAISQSSWNHVQASHQFVYPSRAPVPATTDVWSHMLSSQALLQLTNPYSQSPNVQGNYQPANTYSQCSNVQENYQPKNSGEVPRSTTANMWRCLPPAQTPVQPGIPQNPWSNVHGNYQPGNFGGVPRSMIADLRPHLSPSQTMPQPAISQSFQASNSQEHGTTGLEEVPPQMDSDTGPHQEQDQTGAAERISCERYHAGGPDVGPLPREDRRLSNQGMGEYQCDLNGIRPKISGIFRKKGISFRGDQSNSIDLVYRGAYNRQIAAIQQERKDLVHRGAHNSQIPPPQQDRKSLTIVITAIWDDQTSPEKWPYAVWLIRKKMKRSFRNFANTKVEIVSWNLDVQISPEPDWNRSVFGRQRENVTAMVQQVLKDCELDQFFINWKPARRGVLTHHKQIAPEYLVVRLKHSLKGKGNNAYDARLAIHKRLQQMDVGTFDVAWSY